MILYHVTLGPSIKFADLHICPSEKVRKRVGIVKIHGLFAEQEGFAK